MDMIIDFPGGARVDAHFGPYTVKTDQPPFGGGQGSAPTPFATFLSAIGTCAGIYVLGFCQQRGIPTDGIRIVQSLEANPRNGLVGKEATEPAAHLAVAADNSDGGLHCMALWRRRKSARVRRTMAMMTGTI